MTGRKPRQLNRICDRCQEPKPWRRGYEGPPVDGTRPFTCEDCCRAAGGVWTPRYGWRFPLPSTT